MLSINEAFKKRVLVTFYRGKGKFFEISKAGEKQLDFDKLGIKSN